MTWLDAGHLSCSEAAISCCHQERRQGVERCQSQAEIVIAGYLLGKRQARMAYLPESDMQVSVSSSGEGETSLAGLRVGFFCYGLRLRRKLPGKKPQR